MEYCLLYSTVASEKEAQKIAQILLADGLIACANIVPISQSLYYWQGTLHKEQECILLAKLPEKNYSSAESRIRSIHSYDEPCVLALPIATGSQSFLQWIDRECERVHKDQKKTKNSKE